MAAVSHDLALPAKGTPPDANEVARQVYFANHFYAFKNFSIRRRGRTMTVLINRSKSGKETATSLERHLNNNYKDDETSSVISKDLAIFHSGRMKGTGMLVTEYSDDTKNKDYMIWLPSLRKIRRFSEPRHDDAWGGSAFTFGDVTLRKPEDETHEIIGKKQFRTCLGTINSLEGKHFRYSGQLPERSCRHINKEVYGLKSTTKFKYWWYDYRISYVDTTSFADYRTLYYKNDELIKVIDRDWGRVNSDQDGDPRALFWKYWYGLDLRTGQESWAVIPQKVVEYNSNRKNSFWTEKTLRKIKR
ncbi:MAG: outer membrane lipoprotein-sorting protein [Candidatus Thiodiazotropha sp. (ex Codakia rugifera)]|nr:outer membrane lipoprotein-sorting protein [Candidatus Thiodiazotropha sp. (ex Codakia rugifera)]